MSDSGTTIELIARKIETLRLALVKTRQDFPALNSDEMTPAQEFNEDDTSRFPSKNHMDLLLSDLSGIHQDLENVRTCPLNEDEHVMGMICARMENQLEDSLYHIQEKVWSSVPGRLKEDLEQFRVEADRILASDAHTAAGESAAQPLVEDDSEPEVEESSDGVISRNNECPTYWQSFLRRIFG
ncbi:hypothetical protein ACHAPJ_007341 [Fusarium lateritium]